MHLRHTRASERGLHSSDSDWGSGGHAPGRRWRTALVLQIPAAPSPCAGASTRGRRDWPLSAAPSESSRPCFALDTESSASPAERLQAAIVALAGAGGLGGGAAGTKRKRRRRAVNQPGSCTEKRERKTEGRAPSQYSTKSRYRYPIHSSRNHRRSSGFWSIHSSKTGRSVRRSFHPVCVAMCTSVPSLPEGPAIRAEETGRKAACS